MEERELKSGGGEWFKYSKQYIATPLLLFRAPTPVIFQPRA